MLTLTCCHSSFFWTLFFCLAAFKKLIYHISNTLQISPISFNPVLFK